jgi:ketopantoate reductase
VFDDFQIKYQWVDDPAPAIWERFIKAAAFNLITAYSGKTAKDVFTNQQLKTTTYQIVSEMVSVAEKEGIKLVEQNVFELLEKEAEFSFQQAEEISQGEVPRGSVFYKDEYSGAILRLGKKNRIPTPITDLIDQYLQNIVNPPCPEYF